MNIELNDRTWARTAFDRVVAHLAHEGTTVTVGGPGAERVVKTLREAIVAAGHQTAGRIYHGDVPAEGVDAALRFDERTLGSCEFVVQAAPVDEGDPDTPTAELWDTSEGLGMANGFRCADCGALIHDDDARPGRGRERLHAACWRERQMPPDRPGALLTALLEQAEDPAPTVPAEWPPVGARVKRADGTVWEVKARRGHSAYIEREGHVREVLASDCEPAGGESGGLASGPGLSPGVVPLGGGNPRPKLDRSREEIKQSFYGWFHEEYAKRLARNLPEPLILPMPDGRAADGGTFDGVLRYQVRLPAAYLLPRAYLHASEASRARWEADGGTPMTSADAPAAKAISTAIVPQFPGVERFSEAERGRLAEACREAADALQRQITTSCHVPGPQYSSLSSFTAKEQVDGQTITGDPWFGDTPGRWCGLEARAIGGAIRVASHYRPLVAYPLASPMVRLA